MERLRQPVAAGGNGFPLNEPFLALCQGQRAPPVAPPLFHTCSIPIGPKTAVLSIDRQPETPVDPFLTEKGSSRFFCTSWRPSGCLVRGCRLLHAFLDSVVAICPSCGASRLPDRDRACGSSWLLTSGDWLRISGGGAGRSRLKATSSSRSGAQLHRSTGGGAW